MNQTQKRPEVKFYPHLENVKHYMPNDQVKQQLMEMINLEKIKIRKIRKSVL